MLYVCKGMPVNQKVVALLMLFCFWVQLILLDLNKSNSFDTKAPFWIGIIHKKRHFFHLKLMIHEKIFVPMLDGEVPLSHSYGVYTLQLILIHLVRECSNVSDFNERETKFGLLKY